VILILARDRRRAVMRFAVLGASLDASMISRLASLSFSSFDFISDASHLYFQYFIACEARTGGERTRLFYYLLIFHVLMRPKSDCKMSIAIAAIPFIATPPLRPPWLTSRRRLMYADEAS